MNIYSVKDEQFVNSDVYKKFIMDNSALGYLKIRAYAASQAIPISGLKVIISKIIGDDEVIFFEGVTNESGVIDNILLPVPRLNLLSSDVPQATEYNIITIYSPDNIRRVYKVNIYDNIHVVQNINIVPDMVNQLGDM